MRHDHRNKELLLALQQLNSQATLHALDEGADANALDYPVLNHSFWQTLRSLFVPSSRSKPQKSPSALLVAIDWRWREAEQVGCFRTDGYTPANAPPQDPKVIAALLEHGADVSVTNEVGLTPLQIAAWEGKSETVRLLLEHGATIDALPRGYPNATPLMLAISSEDIPTVRVLIERGADIDTIRAPNGSTALSLAKGRENAAMVRLLEQELQHRRHTPS